MKKFLRIFLIALLSLIAVIFIAIGIALFVVFTPEKLTPIVRKQADKILTCRTELGEVELTFFSTFPDFGISARNISLVNPAPDNSFDTLLKAEEIIGSIDARAFWKKDEIVLKGLKIKNGALNIYADSLGFSGYNITAPDTAAVADSSKSEGPFNIDIKNVVLENVNIRYNDQLLAIRCDLRDLFASINGKITDDLIDGTISVTRSCMSFEYDGEKYLDNDEVILTMPAGYIPSKEEVYFRKAAITINKLAFMLDGSLAVDTLSGDVSTDLGYELTSQPAEILVTLVPPSLASYLKGISVTGLITSSGTIKGKITATGFPLMDLEAGFEKGTFSYEGLPLQLHDVKGTMKIVTDLTTDSLSFLDIKNFFARTEGSSFTVAGRVDHLFSDMRYDLVTDANLNLAEFGKMIPDSLKMSVSGMASGKVRSVFTMSQLDKMLIDRMKLAGTVKFNDFDLKYDSISLSADGSALDFSIPNNNAGKGKMKFARVRVRGGSVSTGKLAAYNASLFNPDITIETSDIRDTTTILYIGCRFSLDSLAAEYDTLTVNLSRPFGEASSEPQAGRPSDPGIHLVYSGGRLSVATGKDSFTAKSADLDADIKNDSRQKETLRQWVVTGFVKMDQGKGVLAGLNYPVEIPELNMNFDPETFRISNASMKIGSSDFQLKGQLSNIMSYYKGDSLLRGNFVFNSSNTDLNELMALTNGLGDSSSTNQAASADTVYTGPYMVPRGIDFVLAADIRSAVIGLDTAKNINGRIVVRDGVLVLDDLSLRTPAARIQLTTIYRTPRKNHIFLGLDYHMFDIEIEELLTMIPDIDSLMPMLRSFRGKGEFHIAIDTYVDSMYNIKKSTLRGAAAIKGNDLVLLDGQTFSEIAKTLKFNKKTENRVDSLAAEFTIFRNEIDVYPFLLVMDKYKAVIVGRHNFDMSFDYHISVVDCPLPIKLGIDIKGTPEDMKYRLAACRYAAYYRPSSRHVVEAKRLELRNLIRESLTSKLKDQSGQ